MTTTPCEVCGTPVNYTPAICCNLPDCDCRGQPQWPPLCSEECFDLHCAKPMPAEAACGPIYLGEDVCEEL